MTRQGPGLEFKRIPQWEHSVWPRLTCSPLPQWAAATALALQPTRGARPLRASWELWQEEPLMCSPSLSH